ncbi:LuxR C-terminal-related transcriptional regulator [Streptomyces sp. NPDC088812]|uniref:LuxR C-terminal-related transcriptional regulator n=1 Tax=Streptomyces sp. NPDC088812 TaxID=3365905 RepID=UPI0037F915A3
MGPLGIDWEVELVYRTLLERPDLDIAELASHLGLTVDAIREALDDLADRALLDQGGRVEKGWLPTDPEMRLGAMLAAEEAEIYSRWRSAQRARERIAELTGSYAKAGRREVPEVEHVVGIDEVRRRLTSLALDTEHEVVALAPGGPQPADILDNSRRLDSETLGRGVRMRTVYVESIRNSQGTMQYAQWLVEAGAEVRTVPVLALRMIVADRTLAIIPFNPAEPRQGALIVRHPGMVGLCLALFEQVWQSASELDQVVAPQPSAQGSPTPQERELLRLLALGHTDDYVGHQLGVSLRTVRRMMATLMRRMGAKSRFQAGATAVSQNWLGAPAPRDRVTGVRPG